MEPVLYCQLAESLSTAILCSDTTSVSNYSEADIIHLQFKINT